MMLMATDLKQPFQPLVDAAGSSPDKTAKIHYMLRVVPNKEITIERKLSERDVTVYLPKETQSRKTGWNRRRLRQVAIFSGAIFIPDFEADLARLKDMTDGIIGYVRFGAEPVIVRPKMLEAIKKFEKLLDVPPGQRKRAFYVGQQVRINNGPFDMWMAHVASLDSKRRLTVLVNMLGRMVPIDVAEDDVEAVL
jgi:transcription antitermination factor NusG